MTIQLYGFADREQLNQCLKEMWRIDEKIDVGEETITKEEKKFYNSHLSTITRYYNDNAKNWFYRTLIM